MTNTKKTLADKLIPKWHNADRGTGGLPVLSFKNFRDVPASRKIEAMNSVGSIAIIANEGIDESFVIMTMEKYFSMLPVNANPKRVPRMMRHEGILYREIV